MKLTKEEKKELRLNFLFGAEDGEPKPLHLLARLEARKLWRKWEETGFYSNGRIVEW